MIRERKEINNEMMGEREVTHMKKIVSTYRFERI